MSQSVNGLLMNNKEMSNLKASIGHLKIAWYGLLSGSILLMIILSALNGEAVSSVSIRLLEGVEEHQDKRIPLIQKKEEGLPDYMISCMIKDEWHTIGTAFNKSAKDWIEYGISDPPSLSLLQSIRVSDKDLTQNDHLDEVQVTETYIKGDKFEIKLSTVHSFKAGMDWFATTPLGIAIFGAIGAAVFLVVFAHLGAAV